MIPCCGDLMGVDPETNIVENCGCPNGIDWRISHRGDGVHVELDGETRILVSEDEWSRAVANFSSIVRSFYFDPPRKPADDDAEWHASFVAEWDRRQALAE